MNENNIKKYQFQKGQSGNPKGRPKGTISDAEKHLTRIYGAKKAREILGETLTEKDFKEWRMILMSISSEDAKVLIKDESVPLFARSKLAGSLNDMKQGRTNIQDGMYEAEFGKPVQKSEVSGSMTLEQAFANAFTEDNVNDETATDGS